MRDGIAALRAQVKTRLIVAALGPKMCRLAGEVADGVLLNWLTPEHARRSGDLVREGAAAAKRPTPTIYAYVRLAMGPAATSRLGEEADRYARIPAYGANFERQGVKPIDTAIAVQTPGAIATALERWRGRGRRGRAARHHRQRHARGEHRAGARRQAGLRSSARTRLARPGRCPPGPGASP